MASDIPMAEICERYKKLYVPLVADTLDEMGLWDQIMDKDVQGLTLDMKVTGPAYTALGHPERSTDKSIRKGALMIDQISQYEVAVLETCGDTRVGHWGELLTNGALKRGANGAVIDGGCRDTGFIRTLGFPVFCKFRCAGDARGRWNVTDMQIPITCGGVRVHPGDFIFGDDDGVVVIPKDLTIQVLLEAEKGRAIESEIRKRVRAGEKVAELYLQYHRF